ncbi:MAG: hypothetical protein WCW27_03555 [Patescibacteria group bacterium]|jgi:hypothetical protein
MSDINFVKQSGNNNSATTKPKHYAVEYTTPNQSKRSLRGWLDWFKGKRKHVVSAATPVVPVKLMSPLPASNAPASNQAQAQAKPEITPIQTANNTLTQANVMPVHDIVIEKTATKLAPSLQPLTKTTVNQPIINQASQPVVTTTPAISIIPKIQSVPINVVKKPEKTVLMKIKPAPHSVTTQTITALRVIPAPPAPPTIIASKIPVPVPMPKPVAIKTLPPAPLAPLKGVPASLRTVSNKATATVIQNNNQSKLSDKNSDKVDKTVLKPAVAQKTQLGDVRAQNVAEFAGQTTNPDKVSANLLHINLLPHFRITLTPLVHKIQQLINTGLLAVVSLAVGYLLLLGYQTYYVLRTNANLEQITALETNIVAYQPLQQNINNLTNQITTVNQALEQHHYWTNIFTILEQYTLPNVYFTLVNADEKGVVTLQAVTSDYASISHQLAVFKQADKYIQSVQVVTATSGVESAVTKTTAATVPVTPVVNNGVVTFNISLQLNPEVLTFYHNGYFKK